MKKGTKVRIEFDASVLNPVKNPDGTITGYRVTDKKRPSFWAVVPLHAIHVVEEPKPADTDWVKVSVKQNGGCNFCFARPEYVWENRSKSNVRVRVCDECAQSLKAVACLTKS